jgi:hypothetical protein
MNSVLERGLDEIDKEYAYQELIGKGIYNRIIVNRKYFKVNTCHYIYRISECILFLLYTFIYDRNDTNLIFCKKDLELYSLLPTVFFLKGVSKSKQYTLKKLYIKHECDNLDVYNYNFILKFWITLLYLKSENNTVFNKNIFDIYIIIITTLLEYISQSNVNDIEKYIKNELYYLDMERIIDYG